MFGGDSKPNMKDATLRGGDVNLTELYEDDYDYETEDAYYHHYEEDETYFDEYDEVDYVGDDDEPPPQEVEEAAIATEEAYISYLDSRKKMRELALARGFYPVVALDVGGGHNEKGKKGGGKGKGKGKGGKNGGASKGKGKNFTPPGAKRFVFGRRGQGRETTSTASTTARSTTSGSTSSHGPRFKRYRLPASGVKEVPDEANMVEATEIDLDVHSKIKDEINYNSAEAGWAIMDSGATRTVCGSRVWDKLAEYCSCATSCTWWTR